ncbi:MAG TPA: glycosyltransferase family 2 protein [Acidimicrobiales bacterium]
MTAPLLSVVLPTHNRSDWLDRAATSVLSQDVDRLELIIVDDASTDQTPAVTERLERDPRVRVVRNSQPLGPGGSRNRGIAKAEGDLLGFCDDDDAWLPGAAAVVLEQFDHDPSVGVVTSWHQVVHERTGHTAIYRGPLSYGAEQLLWYNLVALPFGVIRRANFPEGVMVDPDLPSCEDWDLWLRCACSSPIRTVPHVLYAYHQHSRERVTREGSGDRIGRQRFLDKHAGTMTPACRVYHELVIAQLSGGRTAIRRELTAHARTPMAALAAAAVLAGGAAASAAGNRRSDPGLAARMMARLTHGRATAPSSAAAE